MAIDLLTVGVAIAGLVGLIAALLMICLWNRRFRRQQRLDDAFERARTVRQSGSGLQGTPYSLYGESSWSDHSRPAQQRR